jgi:hypothetical protein
MAFRLHSRFLFMVHVVLFVCFLNVVNNFDIDVPFSVHTRGTKKGAQGRNRPTPLKVKKQNINCNPSAVTEMELVKGRQQHATPARRGRERGLVIVISTVAKRNKNNECFSIRLIPCIESSKGVQLVFRSMR